MKNVFKKSLLFMLVMAGVQVYSDDRIDDFRIGLGGVYGLYQANKQQDITNTGGYLVIVGRESYVNKRIYAEVGGDLSALGTSKYKGGKSEPFYAYDGRVKLGVNIASQANPLFLNVVYNFDNQVIEGVGEYFQTGLHTAGLDLQGFIKSGEKTTCEYNVGYYYSVPRLSLPR